MTALLLIDVQKNMLSPGNPVHDAAGLLDRLAALRAHTRHDDAGEVAHG